MTPEWNGFLIKTEKNINNDKKQQQTTEQIIEPSIYIYI